MDMTTTTIAAFGPSDTEFHAGCGFLAHYRLACEGRGWRELAEVGRDDDGDPVRRCACGLVMRQCFASGEHEPGTIVYRTDRDAIDEDGDERRADAALANYNGDADPDPWREES